ncbi:NADPH-dependent oxidoreductase [Lentilactobacillus kisonensis]|uniref:Oxygen-insensitive NADPH nitroreductase n=1 Tax=Lentilactobacillus kisonensis DSM 19906 = JCM 15041 TaxID=1423766 RepID=A0A0R1NPZ6_9LACO|nr:NADPH-dependent oxidoreductase [Lentilactobacillus kisonensis]KRL22429.1 oxygen-insensitive NADPH nitroreductase [Lentilactobacillus kisonensis DSM 19906 = JCM 15041]
MSRLNNVILDQLFNHTSIRHFQNKALTADQVTTLVEAAQHASTSTFSQQYSIVSVTDPAVKQQLAEITGHHWLVNSGHYFVMVADQYRNLQIAQANNADPYILHTTDKFLASVFDVAVATQTILIAAESMGLGGTIMGSILNDSKRVIELLDLPELTFPLLGLAIGYPADKPEIKPRMPQPAMHFDGSYKLPADFNAQLADYNQTVSDYYGSRSSNGRDESFSHHIVAELGRGHDVRKELLQTIRDQGFLVN